MCSCHDELLGLILVNIVVHIWLLHTVSSFVSRLNVARSFMCLFALHITCFSSPNPFLRNSCCYSCHSCSCGCYKIFVNMCQMPITWYCLIKFDTGSNWYSIVIIQWTSKMLQFIFITFYKLQFFCKLRRRFYSHIVIKFCYGHDQISTTRIICLWMSKGIICFILFT